MRVKEVQVFNLMDTNGRRNDVINAISGYLSVLDAVKKENRGAWASMPNSLMQFDFYRQAIALSPEVFVKHEPYDALLLELEKYPEFKMAVEEHNADWILNHQFAYQVLIRKFDKGIEDRARHYTSNLVKLGFTDEHREISDVGEMLLGDATFPLDALEKLLPVNTINIIYLRQLLKLRIFDTDGNRYYAPFHLAILMLLRKKRFSEQEFFELVQGLSPYSDFSDLDTMIDTYRRGDIVNGDAIEVPDDLQTDTVLSEDLFRKYFKNQKSSSAVDVYYRFYRLLFQFAVEENGKHLAVLLDFYEAHRDMLNKAFGKGKALFSTKYGERPAVDKFLRAHKPLFSSAINTSLYRAYIYSKKLDIIREYSDTTKRIFKATGIIKFDNGFVELAYRELCECIFQEVQVQKKVFGTMQKELHPDYEDYREYEGDANSYFCTVVTSTEFFDYDEVETDSIISRIREKCGATKADDIPQLITQKRNNEFTDFIHDKYPKEKVKTILQLFANRKNDAKIKGLVSPDATVPTIYEYMVGIAWYYFSGQRADLLTAFNLTLSADFEPLMHAGGGQGDIVLYENDKVVMLEATLMNTNTQKRGEWEPVLRHSVNLKIEEETKKTGRQVTTFFIADEFDVNTINIWKAVAAVPLESSVKRGVFTDNVVIMPLRTDELCAMMEQSEQYGKMIAAVHKLFDEEKRSFDLEWRDKFMDTIQHFSFAVPKD